MNLWINQIGKKLLTETILCLFRFRRNSGIQGSKLLLA